MTNPLYRECRLCARQCGIDRTIRAGRCGMSDEIRAARAALHMWEEPCISGTRGSGTVFFSGCPLGCVFCQNRPIALGKAGQAVTVDRLAEIFLELQDKGAHNINLVTPTHFAPSIIEAVTLARKGVPAGRLTIPIVYNTGSYETPETIRLLADTVDVFLPDLKFDDSVLAAKICRAPDYCEVACRVVKEMAEIAGPPVFDDAGILKKGVVVRHLILPGHTKDAVRILRYLHDTYGDSILISVMNQYTPMPGAGTVLPELGRRVTRREYDKVINAALEMGLMRAYYQEGGTASESFIPPFDGEGIS